MEPSSIVTVLKILLLSSLPLFSQIRDTGWPLEVLSWDIDKAYPGVEYNYRIAVRGGHYPYSFSLTSGPDGMLIDTNTGEITWTPATESIDNNVSTLIVDSKGKRLVHNYAVSATTTGFYFVAAGGDNNNDGSEISPWVSLSHASSTAAPTDYIYVKEGTYIDSLSINSERCGRFLAYPVDIVTVIGNGSGNASISISGGSDMIFQGFTFDANDHRWLFSLDGSLVENVIWRNNTMHNASSNDWENPAFIFFWDGPQTPIEGEVHYRNMVIQQNTFYDLVNPNNHGASVTMYNVQDLLYEDNEAYDIDGRGVSDKDDGYRNTIRNNVIHDCDKGISLYNQYTQGEIEVNYNLVYNCETGIVLGGQPGYLKDVFLHHNTIVGTVHFSPIVNESQSVNYNISHNIIGDGTATPYEIYPIRVDEAGGIYHYEYPLWFQDASNTKVRIDNNLIWAQTIDNVAGFSWGIPRKSISQWQDAGFDINAVFADPGLDSTYSLNPSSPYFGIYGRDK